MLPALLFDPVHVSTHMSHPRIDNTTFAAYNWYTDDWLNCQSLAEKFKGTAVESLARAVDKHEADLMNKTSSNDKRDLKIYLNSLSNSDRQLSTTEENVKFKYLMAYRILDAYSATTGAPIRVPSPDASSVVIAQHPKLPLYVLRDLQTFIEKKNMRLMDLDRLLSDQISTAESASEEDSANRRPSHIWKMLLNIGKNKKKMDIAASFINVEGAAVHLAALLEPPKRSKTSTQRLWNSLGSARPPVLIRSELEVFKMLFNVVAGNDSRKELSQSVENIVQIIHNDVYSPAWLTLASPVPLSIEGTSTNHSLDSPSDNEAGPSAYIEEITDRDTATMWVNSISPDIVFLGAGYPTKSTVQPASSPLLLLKPPPSSPSSAFSALVIQEAVHQGDTVTDSVYAHSTLEERRDTNIVEGGLEFSPTGVPDPALDCMRLKPTTQGQLEHVARTSCVDTYDGFVAKDVDDFAALNDALDRVDNEEESGGEKEQKAESKLTNEETPATHQATPSRPLACSPLGAHVAEQCIASDLLVVTTDGQGHPSTDRHDDIQKANDNGCSVENIERLERNANKDSVPDILKNNGTNSRRISRLKTTDVDVDMNAQKPRDDLKKLLGTEKRKKEIGNKVLQETNEGGSISKTKPPEPLYLNDMDDEERYDPPLVLEAPRRPIVCPLVQAQFIGSVEALDVNAEFYSQDAAAWFTNLNDSAVNANPVLPSKVCVMSSDSFDAISDDDFNCLLNKHACILVQNADKEPIFDFAKKNLEKHVQIHTKTRLNDFNGRDLEGHTRTGTIEDMLNQPDGMLSAVDLPAHFDHDGIDSSYFTDVVAWKTSAGRSYCDARSPYPIPDMRWFLASTGSLSPWHIDSNGYGTFISPQNGMKLWYIASPLSGSFEEFRQPALFLNNYDHWKPNIERWQIERIVVKAKDVLYMRPNLPHCVYTSGPTFCTDGHFYSSGTLKDTVVGIYSHIIGSQYLTNRNTEHNHASHSCLVRLLIMYLTSQEGNVLSADAKGHLPRYLEWEYLQGVFFLCIYFELYGALYNGAYNTEIDFMAGIENRSRARALAYSLCCRINFLPADKPNAIAMTGKEAFYNLYVSLLAQHAHLLISVKKKAWDEKLRGDEPSTKPDIFKKAVVNCLQNGYAWKTFNVMRSEKIARLGYDADVGPLKLTRNLSPKYFGVYSIVFVMDLRSLAALDFSIQVQGEVTSDKILCDQFHLKSIPVPQNEYLFTVPPGIGDGSDALESEDSQDSENADETSSDDNGADRLANLADEDEDIQMSRAEDTSDSEYTSIRPQRSVRVSVRPQTATPSKSVLMHGIKRRLLSPARYSHKKRRISSPSPHENRTS
ncbi:hypothetical protein H0H92_015421 [Tricholoma furcatifolium]|nr:hypothetical protein H0H92_015421 [Tricholoma furcatifolium]